MFDLSKIVNDTILKMEEEKYVEKVVKKRLESTVTDIVDDVFRSYSDFGKGLKKYIEESLKVDFKTLNLQAYNTLVAMALKEQLDQIIQVQGIQQLKEVVEEMLLDVKPEYTLSELIEELKEEDCKEEYEYDYGDKITLIIDESSSGYKHIYMDLEDKSKFSCDYQIAIDEKGKPYSIKFKDKELDSKKVLSGIFGLERLLFKIYSAGSKIILDHGTDEENYDIYFKEED